MKDTGNAAAHGKTVSAGRPPALREFFHFAYWLARTYARGAKPAPDAGLPYRSAAARSRRCRHDAGAIAGGRPALQGHGRSARAAEAARRAARKAAPRSKPRSRRCRREIAAAKAANQTAADTHDYRRGRDPRPVHRPAAARGRLGAPNRADDREYEVTGCRTRPATAMSTTCCGATTASRSALVEAKRTRKDPRAGQQQAKLYADCLEAQFGQRPIIFYTNGYEHWIWDDTRLSAAADPGLPTRRTSWRC